MFGGWIPALERVMSELPTLDLHVAALSWDDCVVVSNGVTYHGIAASPRSSLQRWRDNWGVRRSAPNETDRMLGVVRDVRPHVVHIHGTEHGLAALTLMSSVPCLISVQGLLTVCERMSWRVLSVWPTAWLGDMAGLAKAHTPLHQRRALRARSELERRVLAAAKYLGGRTEWDRHVTSILAPQAKYFHCGEVLRPPFYDAVQWAAGDDEAIVYSTIGAASFKGVETLIEAIALAGRRGHNLRLRLAGIGDDCIAGRAARRIASHLGVADRVVLLGYLTASEIVRELERCCAYVSPSHIENSPNGLCEALMMGVPCVATAVGGVPSLVSREDCWLVQDGDPWHMAAVLSEIVEDPVEARARGARARSNAQRRHDPVAVRDGMMSVYESIILDSLGRP